MGHPVLRARARADRAGADPLAADSAAHRRHVRDHAGIPGRRARRAAGPREPARCSSPASPPDDEDDEDDAERRAADGADQPRDHADRPEIGRRLGRLPEHPRHPRPRAARHGRSRSAPTTDAASGSRCKAVGLHRAGDPARDRSSRRRAVLRPDEVVPDADLPRRVRPLLEPVRTSESGQASNSARDHVRAVRFRSSARSAPSRSSSTSE